MSEYAANQYASSTEAVAACLRWLPRFINSNTRQHWNCSLSFTYDVKYVTKILWRVSRAMRFVGDWLFRSIYGLTAFLAAVVMSKPNTHDYFVYEYGHDADEQVGTSSARYYRACSILIGLGLHARRGVRLISHVHHHSPCGFEPTTIHKYINSFSIRNITPWDGDIVSSIWLCMLLTSATVLLSDTLIFRLFAHSILMFVICKIFLEVSVHQQSLIISKRFNCSTDFGFYFSCMYLTSWCFINY